jgi:hypothetical protein
LATVNFSTRKLTSKKTFPILDSNYFYSSTLGFFVSDTVYYMGAFGKTSYFDTTTSTPLVLHSSFEQSIVYTSDMTLTSCYKMDYPAPPSPPSAVTMPSFTINSLGKTSIYKDSSETFYSDSFALSTLDILQK